MPEFTEDVLEVIRKTRAITLPYYGNAGIHQKKDGHANDVVTKLDFEVEEFLTREFNALDPTISFVGEEYGGDRTAKKYWLVDPIDGTMHFVRGMPFCTTMVALVEDGKVVFSAIYDFLNDDIYFAKKGGGAYKNSEPIQVSERPFHYAIASLETRTEKEENRTLRKKLREHMKFVQLICAGYEFILVATGKTEGRICYDPYGKDYDYAPGSLLVEEAGGVVVNVGKKTYDINDLNFVSGNKSFVDSLTTGSNAIFPTKE